MFQAFESHTKFVNGVNIHYRIGGNGPALLLLHGHPQTHFIWHKVADELAADFTVVVADLRGYGDSDKPPISPQNINYSNRIMAADQVSLMDALGFPKFTVLAHDRGARVAHRLGLDHHDVVEKMVLLDIAPTLSMYEQTNEDFARAYWHWFFLIRPAPLPETLIEADPDGYLKGVMGARSAGLKPFTEKAYSEYLRCLSQPGAATAICEDYRASAGIDLLHDREDLEVGKKMNFPVLVLWGKDGAIEKCFDPMQEWTKIASNVSGYAVPCGHYIPEELPEVILNDALNFIK